MFLGLSTRITRPGGSDAPTLTLELLKSTLDSRLTFSRTSSATDMVGGVLTTYAADVPRITLAEGLLLEESRTNLSQQATRNAGGSVWTGATVTGPDASAASAGTLVCDTSTGGHYMSANTVTFSAAVYTISAFVKAGSGAGLVQLVVGSSASGAYANFNISTGQLGSYTASAAGLQTLTGGWLRIWMTINAAAASAASAALFMIQNLTDTRAPGFTGNGTDSCHVYGLQCELGAFVTSYIPTTSSAATRAADSCSMNVASLLNLSEGTLWVEAKSGSGADAAAATSPRLLRLDDGSSNNLHEIRRNAADNVLRGVTTTGGADQAVIVGAAFAVSTQLRAAYAYRANDMAFCQAAASVGADVTGTMPSGITTLRLGAAAAGSGLFNGYIRGVKYWNKRLTNTQLQGVTA